MTDKKLPEKVFIKFNQIEDYYKKSSYGVQVIIANHFSFPPNGVWSEYISTREHEAILAALRAELESKLEMHAKLERLYDRQQERARK